MAFTTFNTFSSNNNIQNYLSTILNTSDYTTGITHWYKFNTDKNYSAVTVNTSLYNYATNTYDGSMNVGSSISTSIVKVGNGSINSPGALLQSFITSNTAMSITFYVYSTAIQDGIQLLLFTTASHGKVFELIYYHANGSGYFPSNPTAVNSQNFLCQSANTGWQNNSSNYNIPLNTWLHVSLVFSGNTLATYYNSVLQNTLNFSYPSGYLTTPNLNGGNGQYMDDFRIYNGIALTSAQVLRIYNSIDG